MEIYININVNILLHIMHSFRNNEFHVGGYMKVK